MRKKKKTIFYSHLMIFILFLFYFIVFFSSLTRGKKRKSYSLQAFLLLLFFFPENVTFFSVHLLLCFWLYIHIFFFTPRPPLSTTLPSYTCLIFYITVHVRSWDSLSNLKSLPFLLPSQNFFFSLWFVPYGSFPCTLGSTINHHRYTKLNCRV